MESSGGEYLFPFLFITIACGHAAGFTRSSHRHDCKQVRTEKDVKPIAYGAMLLEAMVAVFALSCVMVLSKAPAGQSPTRCTRAASGTS